MMICHSKLNQPAKKLAGFLGELKPIYMTIAEKMKELSDTTEYRDKLAQIKKLAADTKKTRRSLVMHMPQQETLDKLKADGFAIHKINKLQSELTYEVSW